MPNPVTLDQLNLRPRLIVSVEGERGTGKSEMAMLSTLLSRPPVTALRFDFASVGVLRKIKSLGLADQFTMYDFDLNLAKDATEKAFAAKVALQELKKAKDKNAAAVAAAIQEADMTLAATKSEASKVREEFDAAFEAGVAAGGTVVIDGGDVWYEMVRLAELGLLKQIPQMYYEKVNKAMDHYINQIVFSECNLVITNKLKDEWVKTSSGDDGREKSHRTGRMEMVGWDRIEYAAHAMIRLYREGHKSDPNRNVAIPPALGGDFYMQILKCNDKASLEGECYQITDSMSGFDQLGELVYGKEEWNA